MKHDDANERLVAILTGVQQLCEDPTNIDAVVMAAVHGPAREEILADQVILDRLLARGIRRVVRETGIIPKRLRQRLRQDHGNDCGDQTQGRGMP